MESMGGRPTPGEAAAAIADAEAGRTTFAHQLTVPRFFFASIGAAVALQIATTAAGLAGVGTWSTMLMVAGLVIFAAVSAYQLARFRRLNGVWLAGLVGRVVGGTAAAASVSYVAALGGAAWAAIADVWWLVPVFATAGGVAYAISGRGWMRRYRAEPAAHSGQESAAWLTVVLVLALAGLVLLVVQHR